MKTEPPVVVRVCGSVTAGEDNGNGVTEVDGRVKVVEGNTEMVDGDSEVFDVVVEGNFVVAESEVVEEVDVCGLIAGDTALVDESPDISEVVEGCLEVADGGTEVVDDSSEVVDVCGVPVVGDTEVVDVCGAPVVGDTDVVDTPGVVDDEVVEEETGLVSPQINVMLLLSVLIYPFNFVLVSSK